jgi:transcription initiation factor TFIID subunit TAF12
VAAAGDPDAEMESTLEAALIQVADDFITGAVTFASGLSQRRKSRRVEAPDISVYFEQTW